MDIKGDLSSTT